MDLKEVTIENIEQEHICCSIVEKRETCVSSKKAWLKERIGEGLKFVKSDVEERFLLNTFLLKMHGIL